jgi:hypothetical protein
MFLAVGMIVDLINNDVKKSNKHEYQKPIREYQ